MAAQETGPIPYWICTDCNYATAEKRTGGCPECHAPLMNGTRTWAQLVTVLQARQQRVIGPAEVAVIARMRDHLDAFLQYCEGGDLPSENAAKRLWVDVNALVGDAVDHTELARRGGGG